MVATVSAYLTVGFWAPIYKPTVNSQFELTVATARAARRPESIAVPFGNSQTPKGRSLRQPRGDNSMKLYLEWTKPTKLRDASRQNLIYGTDLSKLPKEAGVYVFARRWGNSFEALYVGKATDIRSRVKNQLNNLHLMQHVKNARLGKRVLLTGRLDTKPGQRQEKCLAFVERTLIRYFLSEGHDLVNKQGTRLRRHELYSSGKYPKRSIPALMYLEKGKGE